MKIRVGYLIKLCFVFCITSTLAFCGEYFDVIGLNGLESYVFMVNGVQHSNPTLNLTRGCDYTFSIGFGGAPFFIKDPSRANYGVIGNVGAYAEGLSSPGYPIVGVQNGLLVWNLSLSTPHQLFYQCGSHYEMWGVITIVDPVCGPCDAVGSDGTCINMGQCRCHPSYAGPNCSIVLLQGCSAGTSASCASCLNDSLPLEPRLWDFTTSPSSLSWQIVGTSVNLSHSVGWNSEEESALRIASVGSSKDPRGIRVRLFDWWPLESLLPSQLKWWIFPRHEYQNCCYLSLDNFFLYPETTLVYFAQNGMIWPTSFRYEADTWYELQIDFNRATNTYSITINGIRQVVDNGTSLPVPLWHNVPTDIYFGHDDPQVVSTIDDLLVTYGPMCGCCSSCWDTNLLSDSLHCCPLGWTGSNCSQALGIGCAVSASNHCDVCFDDNALPNGGDCECKAGYYSSANSSECLACNCQFPNSSDLSCDETGQCSCTAEHYGLQCNQDCACLVNQSVNLSCDWEDGQCACLPGYTSRNCSQDINACLWWPCHPLADCYDQPAPAPNSTNGRQCECQTGYVAASPTSCVDLNACDYYPCGNTETCFDFPPPAPNASFGRQCFCQAGYERNFSSGLCEDVNACLNYPCGGNMTCYDLLPPAMDTADGRMCLCNVGYYLDEDDPTVCEDINACEWWMCGANALCQDLQPPALNDSTGCVCVCNAGYEREGLLCLNIDACLSFPCDTLAFCSDEPPPAPNSITGRSCTCSEGYVGTGEIGHCQDGNACLYVPCDANAVCFDLPVPAPLNESGRTCVCGLGYTGDGNQCAALSACQLTPCSDNATCENLPLSSFNTTFGRQCTCPAGKYYHREHCIEIDACMWFPCGDQQSTCYDLPSQDNASAGRLCVCNKGYTLDSKQVCQDTNACLVWNCDGNATCVDLPPPALNNEDGRICVCNWGYTGNGTIGNCLQATTCRLGTVPYIGGNGECGNHSSCQFVDGVGAQCTCDPGYIMVDKKCLADLANGTTRVHIVIARPYNVTCSSEFQVQFLDLLISESQGSYSQFLILQIFEGEDEETSVIEMDICEGYSSATGPPELAPANPNGSNSSNLDLPSPNVIIFRIQKSVADSQSPLAQMGVTSVVPLDEPMAPAEPAPRRTRPAPPSSHDLWELILAVVLALLVVAIARALQVRYFNQASGTSTTWSFVRPTDPD